MNRTVYQKGWLATLGVLVISMGVGCEGLPEGVDEQGMTADALVRSQIEAARQGFAAKNLPLTILAYGAGTPIDSDVALDAIKDRMIDSNTVVPDFDGMDARSLSVSTIKERMDAAAVTGAARPDVVTNIQSMVFPTLKTGLRFLEITWARPDGTQFVSTCVYGESGIVYDNILSNVAFVEMSSAEATVEPVPSLESVEQSALSSPTQTRTVASISIRWAWPISGERGWIRITHTMVWNGSSIILDQSYSAACSMSLGSCKAEGRETLQNSRQARIAYAWGWATPTASFKINFNFNKPPVGGAFDVSTSGVGSAGVGQGTDTFNI